MVPGDQLIIESRLRNHRLSLWIFEGVIHVNIIMVAQSEIKLMIFDRVQGTIAPVKKTIDSY